MPIAPNFTSTLHQDWEINFLQCYPNGYLKYTELCNILQLTAGIHADLGGLSFSDMQAHHQAWVLGRMRIEISKLPKWRDLITVKTWIKSLENSRSLRCLEVFLNDEKIVGCETYWVVFNTQTRRPESLMLPHNHFEKNNINAIKKPLEKINLSGIELEKIKDYAVQLSDLDIVNHTNNVKYLEWCLNLVETQLIFKQKITALEMNFIRELSLHDKVSIFGNNTHFAISNFDQNCFVLQIEQKP